MPRQTFGQSCCTTTPTAMWLWGATFAILYGAGAVLRDTSPAFRPYGDTVTLVALAAACFVNFGRNRTLHCGITGPLFVTAAIVALLGEAGVWDIDENMLWGVVLAGVVLAFLVEGRIAGRQNRTSNA